MGCWLCLWLLSRMLAQGLLLRKGTWGCCRLPIQQDRAVFIAWFSNFRSAMLKQDLPVQLADWVEFSPRVL
jgi:hypothetical protein